MWRPGERQRATVRPGSSLLKVAYVIVGVPYAVLSFLVLLVRRRRRFDQIPTDLNIDAAGRQFSIVCLVEEVCPVSLSMFLRMTILLSRRCICCSTLMWFVTSRIAVARCRCQARCC